MEVEQKAEGKGGEVDFEWAEITPAPAAEIFGGENTWTKDEHPEAVE
jgi:hypothetical protein